MRIVSRTLSEALERCTDHLFARINLSGKLAQLEIPRKVIDCVMICSPDIGELKPLDVAEAYFQLLKLGLTKTAAATIASLDYPGRERENTLGLIARKYHTIKSAYGYSRLSPSPILLIRHEKVVQYPEARLALNALLDYEEEVLQAD
jgi:hypothetical protein